MPPSATDNNDFLKNEQRRRMNSAIEEYNQDPNNTQPAIETMSSIMAKVRQAENEARKAKNEAFEEAERLERDFKSQEKHRINLDDILSKANLSSLLQSSSTGGGKLYHRKRKSSRKRKSRRNNKSTKRIKRHSKRRHSRKND